MREDREDLHFKFEAENIREEYPEKITESEEKV